MSQSGPAYVPGPRPRPPSNHIRQRVKPDRWHAVTYIPIINASSSTSTITMYTMCGTTASPRQGWFTWECSTVGARPFRRSSIIIDPCTYSIFTGNEAPSRMSISPPSVCGSTPKAVTITQVVLPGVRMVIKHLNRDQIAMICITPHPASGYSERHKALSSGNGGQYRGLRRMTHLMQHGQLGKRCISLVERRHWEMPPPLLLFFCVVWHAALDLAFLQASE